MLLGDFLDLPWYRTVFTNLGDVISPETLPPLELESRPVDVGELLGDQMSHLWWYSLLRNLADSVAPEKLPPLELTSEPANPIIPSQALLLAAWSNVISTPKVFLPDQANPCSQPHLPDWSWKQQLPSWTPPPPPTCMSWKETSGGISVVPAGASASWPSCSRWSSSF